jgi:glutathione peroxidase
VASKPACPPPTGLSSGFGRVVGIPAGVYSEIMFKAACLLLASACFASAASVYDYTMNSIDGKPTALASFKGKVILLVNVASRCGYTPQYKGLESLYEKNKDQGFVIVGVPANNFMSQEPGTDAEIKTFCKAKYDVQFPILSKVSVKGSDQTPLYQYLTSTEQNPKTGGEIKWNFTKFLIGRDGQILARFEPAVTPEDPALTSAVSAALAH